MIYMIKISNLIYEKNKSSKKIGILFCLSPDLNFSILKNRGFDKTLE